MYLRFVYKHIQMTNAVSKPVGEEILKKAPGTPIEFISMGVNAEVFKPVANARDQLGFNDDIKVLLFVGRIGKKKGIDELVKAMPRILQVYPNTILVIIGPGNLSSELNQYISEYKLNDQIIPKGMIPNQYLPVYYSAADLMILPSVESIEGKEGLPVTIMESLCCGTPVVTTPVGGSRQYSDLQSVTFCRAGDSSDLADKVIRVLGHQSLTQDQIVKEGNRFSISHIAEKYMHIYKRLVNC